jgi:hypothetical protein
MPARLGFGTAVAARQSAGTGDLPKHQKRAIIEIVVIHSGHSGRAFQYSVGGHGPIEGHIDK